MTIQQMFDYLKTYIDKKISSTNEILSSLLSDNKVKTVGSNIEDIKSVADNITDINTTAGSIVNVNTVAKNIDNVDAVANNKDNINTVANSISNVETVSLNIGNVNSVAKDLANIDKVANDTDNIDVVATNISKVDTVSTNINNVNITAKSIENVNTYAKTYQGAKPEDPTKRNDGSPLQVGDLYFNTTINKMKVFDGTTWQLASSAVNGIVKKQTWIGDGSTTVFSVTDGYDSNYAEVFVNGVNVTQDVDLSDGQNIKFNSPPSNGDEILGIFFGSFVLADCYTKAEANDTFVNKNEYRDIDVLNKIKNVDGEGSGLDADLVRGKTPLYREPDFDSGWFSAPDSNTAIMLTHNLGSAPNDIRLLIRNNQTGSIRITTTQYIIYSDNNGYYGMSISRITDTHISVYSGDKYRLGGNFAVRYNGSTDEAPTNRVSVRVLAWR